MRRLAVIGIGSSVGAVLALPLLAASASATILVPYRIESAATQPSDSGTSGDTAPSTSSVGVGSEAWYSFPATCDLPVGCVPVPNVLPAGTLHVGVLAGLTTSVTALLLDSMSLPSGATIMGGTLSLPLDTAATDLSLQPETAGFKACLLTAAFSPGEGLTTPPPASDCTISNPATYETAPVPRYTVDLSTFFEAWAAGKPDHGISLEPFSTAKSQQETWQVAFFSKSNPKASTQSKISAVLDYVATSEGAGTITAGTPAKSVPGAVAGTVAAIGTTTTTGATTTAGITATTPTQVVSNGATAATVQSAAGFAGKGYAYPVVWLLPIALAGGAAWIGRLLTKDPKKR